MSSQLESNIVEILQHRARSQGNNLAYIFLQDGESKETRLTYQELDLKAKAIASQLQQLVTPGSRALLVYPYSAGLEFITAFFGCLYAGVVAVPCHPPKNRLTTIEVQTRLESAAAEVVLTDSSSFNKLKIRLSEWNKVALHCLNTDKIELQANDWTIPEITADTLAFLQYTSGSTGEPKGVMITHGCLMQNQEMLKQAFGHTSDLVGVGWLPLFHDMGLIGNVIQPIYVGGYCVMMSPVSFVQKPLRWLQAISKYQATTSGAPNFAYDLLCDRVTTAEVAELNLSSWKVAFCGAEPVQTTTLDEFKLKFASCGFKSTAFYPCYGMAEATLMITGGDRAQYPQIKHVDEVALEQNKVVIVDQSQPRKKSSGTKSFISAGYPWLDGQILIADPLTLKECEPDLIGEIWYSGSNVGQGYWQLSEQTQQTFQASWQGKQYLRTGDLGFISDGELYITGRLHDVLVFWGLNHYPQHIEQTIEQSHLGLKPNSGAAFSVEVEGKPRLIIAQEIERTHRKSLVMDEVIEAIRWQVFQQHFIDIYGIVLLLPGRIPKTSSGKVQRGKCKAMYLDESLEIWQAWYHQDVASSDVTGLFQRYTNPVTYLKMLSAIAQGKIRRGLYLVGNFKSLRFLGNR
jgi:acyl-CoA synthetase (AMP-forming)/AMP-acid ligase II